METTVSEMTVSELRTLISDVVEEKLAQYSDPDAGLELRDEVRELLLRQDNEIRLGNRGIGLDELLEELGIEKTEIQSIGDNVPAIIS